MSESSLTAAQAHALFDILVHHQLYAEIASFKHPDAIDHYGYPFTKDDGVQTRSPLLQNLLNKFALRLPGLNNVGLEFWQHKIQGLMYKLGEAELSESYDKGTIGARKALATAISAVLEYPARGMLGGYPRKDKVDPSKEYDTKKVEDILQAWDDGLQRLVYGDLLDELFDKTAETGQLEEHSSLVQAVHEYILINLASFMHHIFVLSPDGQYLLHIIENVHRLVPYPVLRQTLRVGNAATMIHGVVRLFLTKLSVTAVTNWMGWTNNTNDGMNLLQQIISQVMAWDTAEFQRRASKLEQAKDAPSKKAFNAIRSHVQASRKKHEEARETSIKESRSIVAAILETAEPPIDMASLSSHHHDILQEYYSTQLSIRDREELTKILCKMQPDLLTAAVRSVISAFDPIIRAVHNAVDLSGTASDLQAFLDDMLKVSKPKKTGSAGSRNNSRSNSPNPNGTHLDDSGLPTVEDYVQLLRKHIPSSHRFLHQVVKNAPDLMHQYREYAKACVQEFRVRDSKPSEAGSETRKSHEPYVYAAGEMTNPLNTLFSSLSDSDQSHILPLLNHHSTHLSHLNSISTTRLKALVASNTSTGPKHKRSRSHSNAHASSHGPGVYLARWHDLLDETLITPNTINGEVRTGREVKAESRGTVDAKGSRVEKLIKGLDLADGTNEENDKNQKGKGGRLAKTRDEVETEEVWNTMRESWEGIVKGMEVMG